MGPYGGGTRWQHRFAAPRRVVSGRAPFRSLASASLARRITRLGRALAGLPARGWNRAQGGRTQVVWEGTIEAKTGGRHTFSLYNSEYAKVLVDGRPVVDRWRQNWNPWHHEFALDLEPGTQHAIRVEWDAINPAYIALLHRDPLPAAEAKDLSIWSEAGQMIDYYVVAGASGDDSVP